MECHRTTILAIILVWEWLKAYKLPEGGEDNGSQSVDLPWTNSFSITGEMTDWNASPWVSFQTSESGTPGIDVI